MSVAFRLEGDVDGLTIGEVVQLGELHDLGFASVFEWEGGGEADEEDGQGEEGEESLVEDHLDWTR